MPVHKLSAMGSIATNKVDYPSMLAGYGDFGAMRRIGYLTSSGSTNQIFFDNIPQGFQDLMVVGFSRSAAAVSSASCYILINNNQANNRSVTVLTGTGSTASSARYSGGTFMFAATIPGASATANAFGALTAHILSYANSTTNKTILTRSAIELNGSGATELTCNMLQSTSPVTSLNIINDGFNNWAAGTTFALYGVRASAA